MAAARKAVPTVLALAAGGAFGLAEQTDVAVPSPVLIIWGIAIIGLVGWAIFQWTHSWIAQLFGRRGALEAFRGHGSYSLINAAYLWASIPPQGETHLRGSGKPHGFYEMLIQKIEARELYDYEYGRILPDPNPPGPNTVVGALELREIANSRNEWPRFLFTDKEIADGKRKTP